MTRGRRIQRLIVAGAAIALGAILIVGAGGPVGAAAPRDTITLNGAGSTFVGPLLQGGWVPGYTKLHPNVHISYGLTGSGAGMSLWTAGKTDFAASDALLNSTQQSAGQARCGAPVTKVPVTIGAVALIYNLPNVPSGIKLTPDVVARIFSTQIRDWNDQRIRRINSGVNLPARPIQVVHRSDGSGTTYIMTHYLSAVSPDWKSKYGSGSTISWPSGTIGAAKSTGVAAAVAQTQGTISYVDLAYAIKNNLSYADVQNAAGSYIAPGVDSASAAANAFSRAMPADLQQVIVNAPSSATTAYPITGYSYIFLCSTQAGATGRALVDFVTYDVTAGQSAAKSRYYAPLPTSVQSKDIAALKAITIK